MRRLITGESWVIDGNYDGTLALRLAAADTVGSSTCRGSSVCGARSGVRCASHGRTRDDLAPGCLETISLDFWRWVWSYPSTDRPGVLEQLAVFERRSGRVIAPRDSCEVRAFLDAVPTAATGQPGVVSIAGQ